MIFDQYDRVRIINLRERTDRRREMEAELDKIGATRHPDLAIFPAVRCAHKEPFDSVGAHGCYLSHLRILEQALADRTSVLILEDDCTFRPDVTSFRQAADTQLFYGGWGKESDPEDLHNSDIIGSHMMGFSSAALEKLVPFLRSLLDLDTRIDPAIVRSKFDPSIRPPIDGAYVWFRRYHPEFRTEFAMLADQRPSASDVAERQWFDRLPVVRTLANRARRVRQRLA